MPLASGRPGRVRDPFATLQDTFCAALLAALPMSSALAEMAVSDLCPRTPGSPNAVILRPHHVPVMIICASEGVAPVLFPGASVEKGPPSRIEHDHSARPAIQLGSRHSLRLE